MTTPSFLLKAEILGVEQFGICQIENYHPPYGIYFDDACFEDAEIDLSLLIKIPESVSFAFFEDSQEVEDLRLRLLVVDDNYISYLESEQNTDLGMTEPIQSFTNINNGFGVITATNQYEMIFERPK